MQGSLRLASRHAAFRSLPVTTCGLLPRDDFNAHEARVCIHEGRNLADADRPRNYSRQQYLRSADEMAALFADVPSALQNTVEIAKRCNLDLRLGESVLPAFPVPEGQNESEFLESEARRGLEAKLAAITEADSDAGNDFAAPYYARLEKELEVIRNMGFPGYFLIVADFIRWARENDVPVGPGPWIRRRLAGCMGARNHGSRSARSRSAVRALPESRARIDAGLRYRLLHGGPRSRHRLCRPTLRPKPGCADHYLRHDGGQGRDQGRRTSPRAALRVRRPHCQARAFRDRYDAREGTRSVRGTGADVWQR